MSYVHAALVVVMVVGLAGALAFAVGWFITRVEW